VVRSTESTISSRQYAGDADLGALLAFLSPLATVLRPTSHWHPGNLLWNIYYFSADVDPEKSLRLWEENGAIVGFAWFDEPGSVEVQVDPRLKRRNLLDFVVDDMLAWAAECSEPFQTPAEGGKLITWASEADSDRREFLAQRGFQQDDFAMVRLSRSVEADLPERQLDSGWEVRPVADSSEFSRRVELHREVWAPSQLTQSAYERLRGAPGFLPELDLVLVQPDGEFASYAICWFDPGSRSGIFEPVGTRPDVQGKGLGRLIMFEGLRRLKALGARMALVSTSTFNQRAVKLYEAVGFREVNRDCRYSSRSCVELGSSGP
jgi:mycothiol synthase